MEFTWGFGAWALLLLLIFAGLILLAIFVARAYKKGGRGRRGRAGPTGDLGPTGIAGPTGFTGPAATALETGLITQFLGFTSNQINVSANNTSPNGSLMTYNAIANQTLDADSVAISGSYISVAATHTGLLKNLHVVFSAFAGPSTSTDPGFGMATLWKTDACNTGFFGTPLSVTWDVTGGTDFGLHCAANTTDVVAVNPFDRFMLVFTATGATGSNVSYSAPASAGLEYTFL